MSFTHTHVPLAALATVAEGVIDDLDIAHALGDEPTRRNLVDAVWSALFNATDTELAEHLDEVVDLTMALDLDRWDEMERHRALLWYWQASFATRAQRHAAERVLCARESMLF